LDRQFHLSTTLDRMKFYKTHILIVRKINLSLPTSWNRMQKWRYRSTHL